jgi:hypothetical protein
MRALPLILLAFLTGCDAWPTVLDNEGRSPIEFQYLHRDYDQWSAKFPIKAGMVLPRGHWIQDVAGIKITDGRRMYQWSESALDSLARACPSGYLARSYGYARDCYLIYRGNGQMVTTVQKPANLLIDKL